MEGLRAPEPQLAAPPSLPTAFIVSDGRLCGGGTGKPAGFHAPDVLWDALGLFGLGSSIGYRCLLSQLAGGHNKKTDRFHSEASVSVFHFHLADDTGPVPTSRCLLAGPSRFFEQERQRAVLLAPHFQLLAHRTRARY
jgi:hypothetical protein